MAQSHTHFTKLHSRICRATSIGKHTVCTPSCATLLSLEAMPIDPFLHIYLIHHTHTHTLHCTTLHCTTLHTTHTKYFARETSNEKVCFYVHKVLHSEKLIKQCLKIEDVVSEYNIVDYMCQQFQISLNDAICGMYTLS